MAYNIHQLRKNTPEIFSIFLAMKHLHPKLTIAKKSEMITHTTKFFHKLTSFRTKGKRSLANIPRSPSLLASSAALA